MSELKACERLFDMAIEVFEFDENEEVERLALKRIYRSIDATVHPSAYKI